MKRSVKMEKERGFGGGAPRALFLATPFRLLQKFGNEFSASSSIASLIDRSTHTDYRICNLHLLKYYSYILAIL